MLQGCFPEGMPLENNPAMQPLCNLYHTNRLFLPGFAKVSVKGTLGINPDIPDNRKHHIITSQPGAFLVLQLLADLSDGTCVCSPNVSIPGIQGHWWPAALQAFCVFRLAESHKHPRSLHDAGLNCHEDTTSINRGPI